LLVHRLEIPLLDFHYAGADEGLKPFLAFHGVPEDSVAVILDTGSSVRTSIRVVRPSVLLEGGETLTMGRRHLTVIWTPGHSPGHICLYDASARLLFGGDHVLPRITPNITLDPVSAPNPVGDYVASLRMVARLAVDLLLPAHGRPYSEMRKRAGQLIRHHAQRKEAVLQTMVPNRPVTAWQVAEKLWDLNRLGYHRRLALQEALAHLQALAVDGTLDKSLAGGLIRWTRP
jgi:glyoxylase-like metal-dependent hydrolase (beta-lactamase superfamily II)